MRLRWRRSSQKAGEIISRQLATNVLQHSTSERFNRRHFGLHSEHLTFEFFNLSLEFRPFALPRRIARVFAVLMKVDDILESFITQHLGGDFLLHLTALHFTLRTKVALKLEHVIACQLCRLRNEQHQDAVRPRYARCSPSTSNRRRTRAESGRRQIHRKERERQRHSNGWGGEVQRRPAFQTEEETLGPRDENCEAVRLNELQKQSHDDLLLS
mmetsp:Transcript_3077/g.6658  ORF Transcript_3077/g.6658 Transcript_3077/m.6658 type:complete len:214 (-) Transcript_3077:183-824(-)